MFLCDEFNDEWIVSKFLKIHSFISITVSLLCLFEVLEIDLERIGYLQLTRESLFVCRYRDVRNFRECVVAVKYMTLQAIRYEI